MAHRLALITGATSGIGRATCEYFARKGIDLLISGRDQEQLTLLQHDLSPQVSVEILQADLKLARDRQRLIDSIHERIPDIVINNAGFGLYGEALTYSTNEQVDILEVNGRAVLEITLETARTLMSVGKKGIILNVSSVAAFQICPTLAVYGASKAFVNQFSQAFDFEFKRHGIRVLTLCPGMVATNFQKRAGGKIDSRKVGVMSSSFVAEQIWTQIERLDPLTIIDWKYRLMTFLCSFIPKRLRAHAFESLIKKRIPLRTLIKIKQ